jgi:ribose-phosphate pyrophosphokinase
MAYIPYARQDRVCQIGDAFSLKVFANLINSLNFTRVFVADAHSSVATALLDRVIEKPQSKYAHQMIKYNKFDYLISPDAGASKKSVEFASVLNADGWDIEVVQALKVRDKSGNITNTNILHDNFEGKSCLMVDDICDGGRTFIELAKIVKANGAGRIGLYVTHGIFSQGVDVLFDHEVDEIYTTDSFEQTDPRVNVVHKFFN